MNQESQLQCMLKQKTREAVCAYLAKSDGKLAQDFLVKILSLGNNDDYKLYTFRAPSGVFYLTYEKLDAKNRITENNAAALYADNFASPALIKLMRFCEGAESHHPKMCAIFLLERFFTHIKPNTGKVPLTEKQRDAAIARFANEVDDSECIEFVETAIDDYIKEFLS